MPTDGLCSRRVCTHCRAPGPRGTCRWSANRRSSWHNWTEVEEDRRYGSLQRHLSSNSIARSPPGSCSGKAKSAAIRKRVSNSGSRSRPWNRGICVTPRSRSAISAGSRLARRGLAVTRFRRDKTRNATTSAATRKIRGHPSFSRSVRFLFGGSPSGRTSGAVHQSTRRTYGPAVPACEEICR